MRKGYENRVGVGVAGVGVGVGAGGRRTRRKEDWIGGYLKKRYSHLEQGVERLEQCNVGKVWLEQR